MASSLFLAASLLTGVLFLMLMFNPQSFLTDVGLVGTPDARFLARRASIFMLALCLMALVARNHGAAIQQLTALVFAFIMGGLALLGFVEWVRGVVNKRIFVAITVESLFAFGFVWAFAHT